MEDDQEETQCPTTRYGGRLNAVVALRLYTLFGLYRWVRNPMYLGVLFLVLGWALYLASPVLAGYSVLLAVGFHARVVMHEEPWLDREFEQQWRTYMAAVPRWIPRVRQSKDGS